MGLNATGLNLMLDALAAAITHISLHTDVVGSGSSGEVTGGSPAYARQAVAWGAASGGNIDLTGTEVFDIPASTTVKRAGFFGHVSASTPYYGDAELTDEVFAGQGTYTLDDADITLT
jgi:hypothetical protein